MTKKHLIALADHIKRENAANPSYPVFCASQNPNFNRERWIGYIYGENGPNGGSINKHMDER